jgi:hypothetical protein
MTNETRAPWTTPVLDQLSVDLDAIAAKNGTGKDGGAKGKNKS